MRKTKDSHRKTYEHVGNTKETDRKHIEPTQKRHVVVEVVAIVVVLLVV